MRKILILLLIATSAANAQTMKQWRDSLDVINKEIAVHHDSLNLQLNKAAVCLQLLEWEDAANT